jgi:hypothetical protein
VREILLTQVRGFKVCDCPPLSTCANSTRVDTLLRSWEELVQQLEETPHMVVADIKVRESAERSK